MNRLACTTALLFALGACSDGGDAESRDMTPEEHAAMEAVPEEPMETAEAGTHSAVHLTAEQERALGVTYTTATRETLGRTIRTVGQIEAPEPNVADVTPKIEGFIERLHVDATGETVRSGQPLLTLYSPELVAAQEELLTALRLEQEVSEAGGETALNARKMVEASRRRLRYWDITDDQIERLERTGEVTKTLTLVAPVAGIVLEKDVFQGQHVTPGARLYRIADLSEVWVEGELFEQDLRFVAEGTQAHIEVAAYTGEHLMGSVTFVYPTVDVQSRTNKVRVSVPNRDLTLKPGMFATVFFDVEVATDDVAVPLDAVVVTGERNLVFVRTEEGDLAPREVVLGARAGDRVQVLQGLLEGETIVASANFLVDAESRLSATGSAMPGMQHAGHGSAVEPAPDTAGVPDGEQHHD